MNGKYYSSNKMQAPNLATRQIQEAVCLVSRRWCWVRGHRGNLHQWVCRYSGGPHVQAHREDNRLEGRVAQVQETKIDLRAT